MALTDLTALGAIEETAHLKPGDTILIQGGVGGVAGSGIQLAPGRRRDLREYCIA
jgi:NADPH:quinone reductase-like Zn-dependent oxidoreductase